MAKNITLMGASYPDVPSVVLPKTGGGTAQFYDGCSVTYSLTGGASANVTPDKVVTGEGLCLRLSVPAGYNLSNVSVTMGGVDITSQVFAYDEDSGGGGTATAHSIYFEFSDSTNTTITAYWDDSFISDAITATTPTTYGQKTVTSAQLDGVEWYSYSPSDIPLNTQLIDYSAVTNGYGIYSDGSVSEAEWMGVSDYTRIDPTMTFTFIGNQWYYLAFYDMSKTFISTLYIYDVTSGTGTGTLSPSNIPSNASWVRITSSQNPNNSELSLIRTA